MLQTVVMLVGGAHGQSGNSHWVAAFIGLYIGTTAATASLRLGQHLALYIYHHLNPGEVIPHGGPAQEGDKAAEKDKAAEELMEEDILAEPAALHRSSGTSHRTCRSSLRDNSQRSTGELVELAHDKTCTSNNNRSRRGTSGSRSGHMTPQEQQQYVPGPAEAVLNGLPTVRSLLHQVHEAAAAGSPQAALPNNQGAGNSCQPLVTSAVLNSSAGSSPNPSGVPQDAAVCLRLGDAPSSSAKPTDAILNIESAAEASQPASSRAQALADGIVLMMMLVMTSWSLWRGIMTDYHLGPVNAFTPHHLWLAVLFGPMGCCCRYYLAHFNGKLPGKWAWFPAGKKAMAIPKVGSRGRKEMLLGRLP
jgi:hypothetical protein